MKVRKKCSICGFIQGCIDKGNIKICNDCKEHCKQLGGDCIPNEVGNMPSYLFTCNDCLSKE